LGHSPYGKEHGLRAYENGVLRRIFGLMRKEATGTGENYRKSFMVCTRYGDQMMKDETDRTCGA
jgi:hypothetical protein